MNHHRQGRGEPLLLIHGVGHHWQGWRPVIDRLSGGFDVIATDSPGFGQSPPLPSGSPLTIDAYADAFAGFIAEHELDRPHVAGNSMGGGIALELARRGLVRSATAISPVGFWTPRERAFGQVSLAPLAATPTALRPAMLAVVGTAAGRTALFAQVFARPWRLPAEEAQAMLRDAWASPSFSGALQAFDDYVFCDGDELSDLPVTVAWGSRDRLLLFGRQAPRARRALPWARHVTLEGLGHTPFYDDPDVVADAVRAGARAAA